MNIRRKVSWFIATCLTGGLLGSALCEVGTLLYRHSLSEQRRLWTPSKFVITPESFKKNSEYVNLSFTPKEKERHFIDLCISPTGHEQYEKMRKLPIPSVELQALNGGQPIQVEVDPDKGWGWTSIDGICINLGLFRGMIEQEYQIRFRLNQLKLPRPGFQLILTVKPDVMATKGRMTMYQLTGLMLQLVGAITFVAFVFKALVKFLKPNNAQKREV